LREKKWTPSDDDYKEYDNDGSSEQVEISYPSLNQTLCGKPEETSLNKSHGDTTPQQSVTLPPLENPKKTLNSKWKLCGEVLLVQKQLLHVTNI